MAQLRNTVMVTLIAVGVLASSGCVGRWRHLGEQAYLRGDYAEARTQFEKVAEADEADWKSHYYLGQIELAEGNARKARTYLEVALSLRAEGPPLQPETPQVIDALAEAMYRQGDHVRLFGFCQEMAQRYGTAGDHIRTAKYLVLMGDHDSALVALRKAVAIRKADDPAPFLALADFYEAIGDREQAITALRRAYGVAPKDKAVNRRLRELGQVPGPTFALPPTP